jgi:hypothetical protein
MPNIDPDEFIDEEVGEPVELLPRVSADPGAPPGADEIILHNLLHLPMKQWCTICMKSRGRDAALKMGKVEDRVVILLFAELCRSLCSQKGEGSMYRRTRLHACRLRHRQWCHDVLPGPNQRS